MNDAEEQMLALVLHQIYQERQLNFSVCARHSGRPYSGTKLRVYSGHREGNKKPLYLDRRFDREGCLEESVRYSESALEFNFIDKEVVDRSGFSEIGVELFRPGVRIKQLSFMLDTGEFFVSQLNRGVPHQVEVLFNVRYDCKVSGFSVACEKIPPVFVNPRRAQNIAYFEKYEMGRYVIGLDVKEYLAAWNPFFDIPKEPGSELDIDYIVRVEPPDSYFTEEYSDESDPEFNMQRALLYRALVPEGEIPETNPTSQLVFHFRKTIRLTEEMFHSV